MSELCSQTTVAGEPCRRYAVAGSDRCSTHLGTARRKTSLTAEIIESLVVMLRAGNYVNVALKAVNVPRPTFTMWLKRGLSEEPDDTLFVELRERVEQARAEGEVRNVAEIAKAARESWQAAAWLLERQHPERWGRVSVRMRDATPVEPVERPAADDPFAEVDELAQRRRAQPS